MSTETGEEVLTPEVLSHFVRSKNYMNAGTVARNKIHQNAVTGNWNYHKYYSNFRKCFKIKDMPSENNLGVILISRNVFCQSYSWKINDI